MLTEILIQRGKNGLITSEKSAAAAAEIMCDIQRAQITLNLFYRGEVDLDLDAEGKPVVIGKNGKPITFSSRKPSRTEV